MIEKYKKKNVILKKNSKFPTEYFYWESKL